ncbi:hypothetical protein HW132_35075, partial [Brasilonema sp. CT11]|nr:hypothetical protein [Brasilonema sp. CT11]
DALKFIDNKMQSAATEYCNTLVGDTSDTFFERVESLTKRFKDFAGFNESEFDMLRKRLPTRSSLDSSYVIDDGAHYHNFTEHNWHIPVPIAPKTYETPKRRRNRPKKRIPQVTLMKLYRVVLNFVMMPVLKTFWPDDYQDPDYEMYPFIFWARGAVELFERLYYSRPYVPFSQVTIGRAQPSHWPLIALGLARQLIPFVIAASNSLLVGDPTRASVDRLLGVLDRLSVIIPRNAKAFLQSL